MAIPSPVKTAHSRKNWNPDKDSRERQRRPCTEEERERVEQWIPLAIRLSRPYTRREAYADDNPIREDAESVAYHALVLAAQDFKPELGYKFVTYAYEVISKRLMVAFNAECKTRSRFRPHDALADKMVRPDGTPQAVETLGTGDEVTWLLNRLRPEERGYLIDRFWEGMNFSQMAESRGLTKQAIENRVSRILQRLRELSRDHA